MLFYHIKIISASDRLEGKDVLHLEPLRHNSYPEGFIEIRSRSRLKYDTAYGAPKRLVDF